MPVVCLNMGLPPTMTCFSHREMDGNDDKPVDLGVPNFQPNQSMGEKNTFLEFVVIFAVGLPGLWVDTLF